MAILAPVPGVKIYQIYFSWTLNYIIYFEAMSVCLNIPNFVFVYTDFMNFRNTILIC